MEEHLFLSVCVDDETGGGGGMVAKSFIHSWLDGYPVHGWKRLASWMAGRAHGLLLLTTITTTYYYGRLLIFSRDGWTNKQTNKRHQRHGVFDNPLLFFVSSLLMSPSLLISLLYVMLLSPFLSIHVFSPRRCKKSKLASFSFSWSLSLSLSLLLFMML